MTCGELIPRLGLTMAKSVYAFSSLANCYDGVPKIRDITYSERLLLALHSIERYTTGYAKAGLCNRRF
jgi:hypothetical protein